MCKRLIAIDESGRVCGQDHHKAKLTDHEVELMRRMSKVDRVPYWRLAEIFEQHIGTVRKICTYQRRASVPVRWKEVEA